MCCGMPLAVTCLSSAVRTSSAAVDIRSRYWQVVLDGLLRRADRFFGPLENSLSISYDDLGDELKTCLLYCINMYPSGYEIPRHGVVRKWMHEGFVEDVETAEACLYGLVSRGLLQPAEKCCYHVHPMMRAFLVCKSEAANDFVTAFHDDEYHHTLPLYAGRRIRRLFVGSLGKPDDITSMMECDVSHTRSLVVVSYPLPHTGWCLFPWKQLERLRVLSLENTGPLPVPLLDTDLVDICSRLLRLRCLGLKGTPISAIPPQIGRLQNLETLDVSDKSVREVPREIGKLHQLKTLDVSHTSVRQLPREFGKLQHLKTLDVSNTSVRQLPREFGKLQHLKTLDVSNTSVRELPWLVPSSVSVLVGDKAAVKSSDGVLAVMQAWNNHTISPSVLNPGKDLSIMLCDYLGCPLPVAGLKLRSRHMMGVPEWVKQHLANDSSLDIRLCKMNKDDLDFMCNKMLYLQLLTLRLEVLPRKPIVITGAGFLSLKSFCLDCRLPLVTFQQGALPKLEHIEFRFYASRALVSEDPVGIRHLLSLRRIVFQSSRYKSDAPGISAVINKVREEAKEHRNRITISINGKDEEVIQEKKKATMTSASSDRISEGNIVTNNGGAGGSTGASMIETNLPIPYNNGTDDEKGGNIIPVKSYYPFGVTE